MIVSGKRALCKTPRILYYKRYSN